MTWRLTRPKSLYHASTCATQEAASNLSHEAQRKRAGGLHVGERMLNARSLARPLRPAGSCWAYVNSFLVLAMGFITPSFSLSTTNSTQSWTSSVPCTWSLLTFNNKYRVTSAESGYQIDYVDATRFTVVSGETSGLFHVRALKNSCLEGVSSRGCVSQSTWVVMTDLQYVSMLAVLFFAVLVVFIACCQRMKPPPDQLHTWGRDAEYGTFETKLAAFLDDVALPDHSALRRARMNARGRDTL